MRCLVQEHKSMIAGLRKDYASREQEFSKTTTELLHSLQEAERCNTQLADENSLLQADVQRLRAQLDAVRSATTANQRSNTAPVDSSTPNTHLEKENAKLRQETTFWRSMAQHYWTRLMEVADKAHFQEAANEFAMSHLATLTNTLRLQEEQREQASSAGSPQSQKGRNSSASPREEASESGASSPTRSVLRRKVTMDGEGVDAFHPTRSGFVDGNAPVKPEEVVLFIHTSAAELKDMIKTHSPILAGAESSENLQEKLLKQVHVCAEIFCATTAVVSSTLGSLNPLSREREGAMEEARLDAQIILEEWIHEVASPFFDALTAPPEQRSHAIRRSLYRASQIAESRRLLLQSGAVAKAKQLTATLLAAPGVVPSLQSFLRLGPPKPLSSHHSPINGLNGSSIRHKRTHSNGSTSTQKTSDPLAISAAHVELTGEEDDDEEDDVVYGEDDFSFRGSRAELLATQGTRRNGAIHAFRYLSVDPGDDFDMENLLKLTISGTEGSTIFEALNGDEGS
jgi:hypothetical protein